MHFLLNVRGGVYRVNIRFKLESSDDINVHLFTNGNIRMAHKQTNTHIVTLFYISCVKGLGFKLGLQPRMNEIRRRLESYCS